MAIKWSPGCGCCGPEGCGEFTVGFTPSSPLSRGEYDHLSYWQPFTEYLMGDQFLMQHLDPDSTGQNRTHVWEVTEPSTFSGPGWTYFEMSRYTSVGVVDYLDRPKEWLLYGGGWPYSDTIEMERLIQNRLIPQNAGIVSEANVLSDEWKVRFFSRTFAEARTSQNPPDLDLSIRTMAGVTMEAEDTEPTSGVLLHIESGTFGDERCNPAQPQDTATFIGRMGTFNTSQDNIYDSDFFSVSISAQELSYSVQPTVGTVVGALDLSSGTTQNPLDLFDMVPFSFFQLAQNPDFRVINRVLVVQEAGVVRDSPQGTPFPMDKGDLLRVVDKDPLIEASVGLPRREGSFERIAAGDIEATDLLTAPQMVEAGSHVSGIAGKRLAVFLERMDTANPDDRYLFFEKVEGSIPASLARPECPVHVEYECPCDNPSPVQLRISHSGGVNITDHTQFPNFMDLIETRRRTNSSLFDPPVVIESGLEVMIPTTEPEKSGAECFGFSGKYAMIRHYSMQKEKTLDFFGEHSGWNYVRYEAMLLTAQRNTLEIEGMLGQQAAFKTFSHIEFFDHWSISDILRVFTTTPSQQQEDQILQQINRPIYKVPDPADLDPDSFNIESREIWWLEYMNCYNNPANRITRTNASDQIIFDMSEFTPCSGLTIQLTFPSENPNDPNWIPAYAGESVVLTID